MIKPILLLGNKALRKKALPVKVFPSKELAALVRDLSDTLHDAKRRFGYGRGIAAPQIGVLKRVVLVDMPGLKSSLINPKIVHTSARKVEVWDSCFCFNFAFFVLVDRYYAVRVEYFDLEGRKRVLDAKDELSELLQHEVDHLDGVLATDRMKDKGIMMELEWKRTVMKHVHKKRDKRTLKLD
jgi:peptide deformylase